MRLTLKIFAVLVFALVLNGCATPPETQALINQCSKEAASYVGSDKSDAIKSCVERFENAQARQEKKLKDRAYLNELQARCLGFGFKRNTNEFSNCLMVQKQQDDTKAFQDAQIKAQSAERLRKSLRDMNDALKPQWIPNQCPEMLNAKPGQYGPGCN